MKILFATSEALPYIKIGGLGDVSSALPKALAQKGADVSVVMPFYKSVKDHFKEHFTFITACTVSLGWRNQYCGVFYSEVDGVKYYLIDNEYYFRRDAVYGHYDDGERYAYFCKAILEMLPHIGFSPDIIHANDWQCALIPLFLDAFYKNIDSYRSIKTMFTIHNIEYQGQVPYSFREDVLGVHEEYLSKLATGNCLNFMFSAICLADQVTTVSKTYAEELKMPYFGKGLNAILADIPHKFCGITNGIDTTLFDPSLDPNLPCTYSADDLAGKAICKQSLQAKLHLAENADIPIIAMVSRLVSHKGLDLVNYVRHELLQRNLQLAVLGTGEAHFESMIWELARNHPGKVSASICFSSTLASQIYAGCDLFLMPSQSEPCGLSQMIAMRYGAVPIVRQTGGLKDTVKPIGSNSCTGQGFTFQSYNAHDMLNAIDRSLAFYFEDKTAFLNVIKDNMTIDFSWQKAASEYLAIYESM